MEGSAVLTQVSQSEYDPCAKMEGLFYSACKKKTEKALKELTTNLGKLSNDEFEKLSTKAGLPKEGNTYKLLKVANQLLNDKGLLSVESKSILISLGKSLSKEKEEEERPCLTSEIYKGIIEKEIDEKQLDAWQKGNLICRINSDNELTFYGKKQLEATTANLPPCSDFPVGLQVAIKAEGKCYTSKDVKIGSISPSAGPQGGTIVITISGDHLPQKDILLDLGEGITIGEISTSESGDILSTKISIDPDAKINKRDVKVLAGEEIVGTIKDGFEVKKGVCTGEVKDKYLTECNTKCGTIATKDFGQDPTAAKRKQTAINKCIAKFE